MILAVGVGLVIGIAVVIGTANLVGFVLSAPPYRGPVTDHFDGTVFHNRESVRLPDAKMGFRYFREGVKGGPWERWRDFPAGDKPPERVADGALRVAFINHATALVQMDGVNLLTDPIYSERAFPWQWMGPRRHHAPGIAFEDLPPIDLVLVSHNHYDHMDARTLRRLMREHDPLFVTGLGNGAVLQRLGISRFEELDWDGEVEYAGARVIAQRARHFSSRGLADRMKNLWVSFVIEGPHAGCVYFAGDTSYGSHFAETGERFGPIRLALLPIGAYEPDWFMRPVHMNPDDAVRAHQDLRAQASLAIHFGTFRLTKEGQDQPVADLARALDIHAVPQEEFWVLDPGQARDAR